jgi:hypothetical protein
MKITKIKLILALFVMPFSMAFASSTLLYVDVTDISRVTFTANLGGILTATDTTTVYYSGISLEGIFASPVAFTGDFSASSSDLHSASSPSVNFKGIMVGNIADDLGAWSNGWVSGSDMSIGTSPTIGDFSPAITALNFIAGNQAFVGTLVVDLTGFQLASVGTIGNIYSSDPTANGPIIGQFQVIPEPATVTLYIGSVVLGVALVYSRKRRA